MVTPILLAAAAAALWGTSDYCGGRGARRAGALTIGVVSQAVSLPALAVLLLVVPGTLRAVDLGWGALAGVAGLFGVVLLYQGLATGAMIVVSPVTAVTAAVVPLGAGLVLDGPLSTLALVGVAVAVLAIALVSIGPNGSHGPVTGRLIGVALASGVMFGLALVLLGQVGPGSGMWALAGLRVAAIAAGVLLALRSGALLRPSRTALTWATLAGTLDLLGSAMFLTAVGQGHLSVVAVLASLYPASTVLLALGIDRERVRLAQFSGLALAALAIILVTGG